MYDLIVTSDDPHYFLQVRPDVLQMLNITFFNVTFLRGRWKKRITSPKFFPLIRNYETSLLKNVTPLKLRMTNAQLKNYPSYLSST